LGGVASQFEWSPCDACRDYLLCHSPNFPLAVIEAKDNNSPVGGGMQQCLTYAEALDVPFVFTSNGDAFMFHDRTGRSTPVERLLTLAEFPSPAELWARYRAWKGVSDEVERVVRFPYHDDGSGKEPRYYRRVAIQRVRSHRIQPLPRHSIPAVAPASR
jgi:type I restriction enzyme R subunit